MILYLDCSSGVSGDMLVAALLSLAGATEDRPGPLDKVVRPALRAAGIDRRLVSIAAVRRGGVDALSFRVPEGPGFATFDELIMSMYASRLDEAVADTVAALAQRMAAAEREVHGERVHEALDELGGLDTAVDLISATALMRHLAPERVVASPPALGGGTVETAHGELDVPAPAVAVLVRDIPTAPPGEAQLEELTTPTGAALLTQFADEFGPVPAGDVVAAGAGAGSREVPGRPNVLRAYLIEPARQEEAMDGDVERDRADRADDAGAVRRTATGIAGGVRRPAQTDDEATARATAGDAAMQASGHDAAPEEQEAGPPAAADETLEAEQTLALATGGELRLDHVVLEATIDDMAPELLAHAAEVLRDAGALDVWMTQALMKKGRPGVVLHVLAPVAEHRRLAGVVFAETSTFGLRVVPVGRLYAEERRETIKLGGHDIRIRLSLVDGRPATVSPEYEDCRRAAEQLKRPAKVVYEAAQAAARARFSGS